MSQQFITSHIGRTHKVMTHQFHQQQQFLQMPSHVDFDIWSSLTENSDGMALGSYISTTGSGQVASPGSDCQVSGGGIALPTIDKFPMSHQCGSRSGHTDMPELDQNDLQNHLSELNCLLNNSTGGGGSSPDGSDLDTDLTRRGGRGANVMSPDSQMCVSSTARDLCNDYTLPLSPTSVHFTPTVPSSTRYPGDYGFEVSVEKQPKETKSASWTANMENGTLQKLYVRLAVPCPFIFKTARPLPPGAVIRALPVYMKPEHVQDIVRRCPNHSAKRAATESPLSAQHLIRLDHQGAQYLQDSCTGRLSVIIPHELPQAGAEWVTYLFQFMCFSSCVGGLNRRPVHIIFTLELDGQVLGRQSVEVRICACPGRDRIADERDRLQLLGGTNGAGSGGEKKAAPKRLTTAGESVVGGVQIEEGRVVSAGGSNPGVKKRKVGVNESVGGNIEGIEDEGVYTLRVRGRENYELLLRLRDVMELRSLIPQHIIDLYTCRTPAYNGEDFLANDEDNKLSLALHQQHLLQQQQQQQQQQRQSPTYDMKLPRKCSPPLTPCSSMSSPLSPSGYAAAYRGLIGAQGLIDGQGLLGGADRGLLNYDGDQTFSGF